MKVLVTGASGFLGSVICRQLVSAGYQVTAFCRAGSNTDILRGLHLAFRTADVTDQESVQRAVEGHDYVIHAAANIRNGAGPLELERVNVAGTSAVVSVCREQRVKRIVHISSMSAIGIPPRGTIGDERIAFNLDQRGLDYCVSKNRAEEAIRAGIALGLNAVIVNPTSIFGPCGRTYRGSEMVFKVRRASIVPYFTGGICTAHVEDVAGGVIAALKSGRNGERYILGGENVTYEELARRSAAAMGLKRVFVPVGTGATAIAVMLKRLPFATHYIAGRFQFYSSAKAGQELGYRPRSFDAILQECVAFGGQHQNRYLTVAQ